MNYHIQIDRCANWILRHVLIHCLGVNYFQMPRINPAYMHRLLVGDRPTVIGGQFSVGMHFSGQFRTGRYFFFLRDPIERVLSYYQYIRSLGNHPLHRLARDHPVGIFVQLAEAADFHNGQVRYLAERSDIALFPSLNVIDDGDLALAVNNLNLSEFGFVEDLEKSVQLIAHRFDRLPPELVYKPKSKWQKNYPDDQLQIVEDYNLLDLALYDAASNIYRDRLEVLNYG